ncbi:hypothetical protein FB451DRAFT_1441898 [Mycena latifolia]|nr:hypothetical protein FB451DRAFT_1441898 [Mycena latifolia]
MADAPDAPQLNEKAGTLFRNGRYEEAAKTYEDAIVADNGKSAVYYSNLAAAYLKLQRFELAQDAAHNALMRDCRSVKARYRRSMARRGLGLLPHCLVDLSSVLAMEPAQREARAAFVESMHMHDSAGNPSLSVAEVRRMDFPPAHGSALTAPASPDNRPSVSQAQRPAGASKDTKVMCNGCHSKFLNPVEAIYCPKCGTSPYCNEACRRADGHLHRIRCPVMAEHRVLLKLSESLAKPDPYLKTLFEKYATRALGQLVPIPPLCLMVLIAHLGVVSSQSQSGARTHTQRLCVEQLNIVPLSILPAATARSCRLVSIAAGIQKAANATVLPMMFSPNIEVDLGPNEPPDSFAVMNMLTVTPVEYGDIESTGDTVEVYSRSFGVMRELKLDLDVLYRAIEDEIELDVDNYYRLMA